MELHLCKDFPDFPGGRFIDQGDFSGEYFRKYLLIPKLTSAIKEGEKLLIDLDGAYGYPPGFLEEAFGGLIRELDKNSYHQVLSTIRIKCDDTPSVIQDIMQYMNTAIEAIENPTTSFITARQNFTAEIYCTGKLKKIPPINGCAVSDTTEKTLEKQEKEVIAPP